MRHLNGFELKALGTDFQEDNLVAEISRMKYLCRSVFQ